MERNYKLRFFNAMSYAEPIRFIFAYTKADYEDIRIERSEWPALKETTPWGKLPVLEFDGHVLSQSRAIGRYLGVQYGLAGENDWDAAKIDEYLDVMDDLREECIKYFHERDEEKKKALLKNLDEAVFPKYFGKFSSIINIEASGFLVGRKVTIADLFLATLVGQLLKLLEASQLLIKYPKIKEHLDLVNNQSGIKEYIEKRPITQF